MWRTTKTAACKLRFNERASVTSASTPPAEAPTTMISCPGIFPPGDGETLFVRGDMFHSGTWLPVPRTGSPQGVPLHFLASSNELCFYNSILFPRLFGYFTAVGSPQGFV